VTASASFTAADEALLDTVQRDTLRFFWDFGHPVSGLARDRTNPPPHDPGNDVITIGGTGMGIMALIVGAERGWLPREAVLERLARMVAFLEETDRYHGVFAHFVNGTTGRTIPFGGMDDGADLVETAFLMMGLLTAREYFAGPAPAEASLRAGIARLWDAVDWARHVKPGGDVLMWHWSPNHGFGVNMEIRGWNECLVAYVLAVASGRVPASLYHTGWAHGPHFRNGLTYYGLTLPLGPPIGGPLFFTHYSFMGLDPRGLTDRYADYFHQNRTHALVNYRHCVENPGGFLGYGPSCWGLTASDSDCGYLAHAPDTDRGVITPTAAIASLPYVPAESLAALRGFCARPELWTEWGPMDAFNDTAGWRSGTCLAIDQAPIVGMVENARSGLLWRLFMGAPEVRRALEDMGFSSPHLSAAARHVA
jgi:hypothetical protein